MSKTTFPAEQGTIHFTVQGEGIPVVLVHGLGSSLHEWDWVIPALSQAGYRVYACDLPGHGDSYKPAKRIEYNIETMYQETVDWINSLQLEAPFFLAGHSLGGYLSLELALQYPSRLRGLVLVDPFYGLEQVPRILWYLPGLFPIGQKIMHATPEKLLLFGMQFRFIPSSCLSLDRRQQQAIDARAANPNVAYLIHSIPSLLPQVSQIQLPVLVVWGSQDRSCKPQSFPLLVAKLPHAQEFCASGCGHHPHLQKPDEVNQKILTFFATS